MQMPERNGSAKQIILFDAIGKSAALKLFLLIVILLIPLSAIAEEQGFYLKLGISSLQADNPFIESGYNTRPSTLEDTPVSLQLGYNFDEAFSVGIEAVNQLSQDDLYRYSYELDTTFLFISVSFPAGDMAKVNFFMGLSDIEIVELEIPSPNSCVQLINFGFSCDGWESIEDYSSVGLGIGVEWEITESNSIYLDNIIYNLDEGITALRLGVLGRF